MRARQFWWFDSWSEFVTRLVKRKKIIVLLLISKKSPENVDNSLALRFNASKWRKTNLLGIKGLKKFSLCWFFFLFRNCPFPLHQHWELSLSISHATETIPVWTTAPTTIAQLGTFYWSCQCQGKKWGRGEGERINKERERKKERERATEAAAGSYVKS